MKKYDTIIVGCGPAGIFTALELLKSKPDIKLIMFDKGNSIKTRKCPKSKTVNCVSCKPCNISCGFGGAGAFSDGKLSLSPDVGGWLADYIGEDKLKELIDYVDQIYLDYGGNKEISYNEEFANEFDYECSKYGLKFIKCPIRHLGTEKSAKIMDEMYDHIISHKNAEIVSLKSVDKIDMNKKIITINNEEYYGDNIVLSVGRSGSEWLINQCKENNVKTTNNQVDIGVRVECPNLVMEEINENLYEGKFLYKTSVGSTVRTFCSNPGGHVVVENYEGVMNVNGHSYNDSKLSSNNTNFALLVSHHFEEPFKKPNEYAIKVSSMANQLSCGSVIVQKYGDIKLGRRSTKKRIDEGFVRPTLKEAVPGDLALALPYKTMRSIIEMIEVLDKITPGIATEHTLLYGVEAKYYSAHPEMDDKLEVSGIKNLYVAGDGAGLTRGLAQASACGVYIARNIIGKKD